jgi:hypothetical protein
MSDKRYTKKNRVLFVNSVKDKLKEYLTLETKDVFVFTLKGCTITLEKEQHHTSCFSVYCMFKEHNELCGTYNNKYNWHSFVIESVFPYIESILKHESNVEK